MVDTLLTADALAIGRDELADAILIASDDDDMLPAIMALLSYDKRVIRLRRAQDNDTYYEGLLALKGLTTHHW